LVVVVFVVFAGYRLL